MNSTILENANRRNISAAVTLRREQDAAKLRGLVWYRRHAGVTRVWFHQSSGRFGYAGGILRTNRDAQGNKIKATFDARTFNADHTIAQTSGPLATHRAALLWLATVNGL